MMSFRSISLLRRPHTRLFSSQHPPAPNASSPRQKFNLKAHLVAKAKSQAEKAEKQKKPLRDAAIPYRLVRLVDPETSRLTSLRPLQPILAGIDSRTHYLELMTEKPEPVVKIIDRRLEVTRAAEAKHRAREVARKNLHKEVQLSWAAAPADLAHKISKVREDLLRGVRVDIVFARKSKQSKLGVAMMHQRASEAIESLLDVSREWKEREVRPAQGLLAVFLRGTITADTPADTTHDTTESQPEPSSGKKFALFSDTTLTDQEHLIRRMRKELSKGARVELVLSANTQLAAKAVSSAKVRTQTEGQQDQSLSVDELRVRAEKLIKTLKGETKEWRERDYRPISEKLYVYLENEGGPTRGKVAMHKGPKPKKMDSSDIPDLTQD